MFASNTVIRELGRPRSFFDFGKSIVGGSVVWVIWTDGDRDFGRLGDLGDLRP